MISSIAEMAAAGGLPTFNGRGEVNYRSAGEALRDNDIQILPGRERVPFYAGFFRTRRRLGWVVVCGVLFLAALARYWVRYDAADSVPFEPEPPHLARNLSQKGQFANPFPALDTGPSAHLAPAFPAFYALVLKVAGAGSTGMYAFKLAAVLILSLQLALFPVFSRILGMGGANGILAAFVWIMAKPRLVFGWEAFYAAALIAVACCFYRRYLASRSKGSAWLAWPLGCLMGLLMLTVPTVALVLVAWLAYDFWRDKSAFLNRALLPLVLLPAAIVAPWTIRNYLVLHRLVLVRDDFGLELKVSNNDCAEFGITRNMASGCFNKFHPSHNVNEARKVRDVGEVKYSELRLREALHWITGHPARFAQLSAMRFVAFWLPTESGTVHYAGSGRRLERVVIYLMTLLSVPGLLMLYRRDAVSATICLSCLALFPLVYYVVQFEYRYRYPILWVTFLLGALPIATYLRRFWDPGNSVHIRLERGQDQLKTTSPRQGSPAGVCR